MHSPLSCGSLTVVIIGFEHTLYNVEEGDGGVEVCVIFSEPQVQLSPNFIASGNLSSFPNTATGKLCDLSKQLNEFGLYLQ